MPVDGQLRLCIDAWQGIPQHIEFQELDTGIVLAVLNDEVVDDVRVDSPVRPIIGKGTERRRPHRFFRAARWITR
jgi:hypothetical protein